MRYSVLVPFGYSSTWLSREILSKGYEIEPVNKNEVNLGRVQANMGSYFLLGKKLLVHPTSPGFDDEGGIENWAGKYLDSARYLIGIGWCNSQKENELGKIIIPTKVALSTRVISYKGISGNDEANPWLVERLKQSIAGRGYEGIMAEIGAYTLLNADEIERPPEGVHYCDMEAGILIRYGNQRGLPTACVYAVSDDKNHPIPGDEHDEDKVSEKFLDNITTGPLNAPFRAILDSVLKILD